MKKILKWGIIGLGKASSQFIDSFETIEDHKIEILSSISKTKNFNDKKNLINNISNSYLDVIKSKEVDIVFIGLPNNLHYEYSKLALQNGKHVLVEKPACTDANQFNDLLGISQKNNLKIFEGIYFRSHPNILEIIKILKKNNFKNLTKIISEFGNDALGGKKIFGIRFKKPNENNRLFAPKLFGGAVLDTGCYPITFANIFLKEFNYEYLNHRDIIDKKSSIGSTGVDMESELFLNHNNVEVKLKTSLINNLKNSIQMEFLEGKVEISNLLNLGNLITIKLNIKNKFLEYKLNSNLNIMQSFKNKILQTLNNNEECFSYPLVNNFETLENIKILNKWCNLNA
jgi:predicted dehydrogenase